MTNGRVGAEPRQTNDKKMPKAIVGFSTEWLELLSMGALRTGVK